MNNTLVKEGETSRTLKTRCCRLTTIDNPFDPFDQFDEWYAYDEGKGYHTCSYLARICKTSVELGEADQRLDEEIAMDEIILLDFMKIYKKVIKYL